MVLPVSAVASVAPTSYLDTTMTTSGTTGAADFGSTLAGAVDNLQQLQSTSDTLAIKAVTGDLNDIHQATIAATRAQVTMEVVAAVRNKGVEAFNEIMRMQA
ncbi:MAG: flagellar hook-basal body complex protein FliE [Actinobacteria bacterium]|nr:flagellar hook-basal body complex protein FliE [Actinomycetota bacterium]